MDDETYNLVYELTTILEEIPSESPEVTALLAKAKKWLAWEEEDKKLVKEAAHVRR